MTTTDKFSKTLSASTSISSGDEDVHLPKRSLTMNPSTYYKTEMTKKIIHTYGASFFSSLLSSDIPKENLLLSHTLTASTRSKTVDWMTEIFNSYPCNEKTFFLSVEILDKYLQLTPYLVNNKDIHLIALCSIFIASKMEDIQPLHIEQIVKYIGYNKFGKESIIKKEREILQTISFDLYSNTVYDFIMTMLVDFQSNNLTSGEFSKKNNINELMKFYEKVCVYLSKLISLSDEFCSVRNYVKAVCVIIAAFDIFRLQRAQYLDSQTENFFRNWVFFVINESRINKEELKKVCEKIIRLFNANAKGEIGNFLHRQTMN